jgi:hypothetical protein
MHAAAELPRLIATCFRCHARFAGAEPAACPGCGGAVILEVDDRDEVAAGSAHAAEASRGGSPAYLPGVHVKLEPERRKALAARCGGAAARSGGGTSVHARLPARTPRRDVWAVKLVSMAALLATFALFLQGAH